MFGFKKKSTTTSGSDEPQQTTAEASKLSLFARVSRGLKRTRQQFGSSLGDLFLGKKTIDAELLAELETQLLIADVGIEATQKVIAQLTQAVQRKQLNNIAALQVALEQQLLAILSPVEQPLTMTAEHKPFVVLMVGVNGAGKTTTIGKLAKRLQTEGKSVLLAAGDTFRAAAIEQLQAWGERNQIAVVAQTQGSDSASVIFDALSAAKARGIDVLIADTAGRLHTQTHLMNELEKISRVIKKIDPQAPHETMLVLDAGIGQNALRQAEQFDQAVKLTGITVTKLDGTAKGGILFALADKMRVPVRFIGVGEAIDDLQPFDAKQFVQALFHERL